MFAPVGFQEDLYGINVRTPSERGPRSLFYLEPEATSWYVRAREDLELNGNNYRISNTHKFLLSTQLRVKLPAVRVKTEHQQDVRIAYHHKVGHNIVDYIYPSIAGTRLPGLNTHSLNVYVENFTMPGDEHKILESIGAVPRLEDWHSDLPPYELSPMLPFFWHWHSTKAMPIHMLDEHSEFKLIAKFRLRLSQLLRMQIRKDGQWVEITPDLKLLDEINPQIDHPTIKAEYTNNLQEECDLYYRGVKSCDDRGEFKSGPYVDEYVMYINSFINESSINTSRVGERPEISLTAKSPCHQLWWMANNSIGLRFNAFSNYTTRFDNVYEGWNPCVAYSLLLDDNIIQDQGNYVDSERHVTGRHNRSPAEAGYNTWSPCIERDAGLISPALGTVFGKHRGRIIISLGTSEPGGKEEDASYHLEIVMLVTQKLVFQRIPGRDVYMVKLIEAI